MAGNDSKKAEGDSARSGKKSGTASTGGTAKSGKGKASTGGEGKGGKTGKKSGKAIPIAAAAAAAAVGGAAVVVVRRRRRKAEAAAEAERGKTKRSRKSGDAAAAKKPRAAGGGLAQPVRPDAALGAVIGGTQPRTRAEITRQVWDYIRSKGLQDATNRRSINADAALRAVFGKDQVTMFELPGLINSHVEKV